VRSSQSDAQAPVTVIQLHDLKTQGRSAIEKRIAQLQAGEAGTQSTVLILGRYNHDREHFPKAPSNERIRFITVHGSKGLEADHVIVASMTSETLGFPSRVEDDPVLQLALPDPEPFLFAEERRLFYVALTRARKSVTLLTELGRESTFITELVRDYKVPVSNFQGEEANVEVCPGCGRGTLVQRKGPWGLFLGCSTFPACKFKLKIADTAAPRTSRRHRNR